MKKLTILLITVIISSGFTFKKTHEKLNGIWENVYQTISIDFKKGVAKAFTLGEETPLRKITVIEENNEKVIVKYSDYKVNTGIGATQTTYKFVNDNEIIGTKKGSIPFAYKKYIGHGKPHKKLDGTWVNEYQEITFDFYKGTFKGKVQGKSVSQNLTLVKEIANVVVFKTGSSEVVCHFINDDEIYLSKKVAKIKKPIDIPVSFKRHKKGSKIKDLNPHPIFKSLLDLIPGSWEQAKKLFKKIKPVIK